MNDKSRRILTHSPNIQINGLRKTMKILHYDGWSLGQDSNLGLPEHKTEVLSATLWHQVFTLYGFNGTFTFLGCSIYGSW